MAAAQPAAALAPEIDELGCVVAPKLFMGVARLYDDFSQVIDEQVAALLATLAVP